ncbi:ABC transporter substrate-binding protein [Rhodopseudomonas sp. BAL398]|nr:ABC transporter substrate-binding protein [Rhodopseudomonas sp. BAL398]MDF3810643.1 ABC transporter substrate-binding protein [Rhodopseudomonas sp. BAL398]WOK16529.1 ABC transporter substrate-binding protein [Rhodopseudomonas sp. BAL398]
MSRLTRRDFLMTTAAAGLAASFAGSAGAATAAPKKGGTLLASWGGFEPQALFVPAGGGSSPYFTATKVHERLFRLTSELKFEPELALEIKPAADFRSYTIKLRDNVKWHDGKPFTADDVVYNAMEYWKPISGGVSLNALQGAEAVDPLTVVLKFSAPVPEFFLKSVLAGKAGLVIAKHIYAGSNIITNPINNTPVGTGPYKVKEWVRGSHVEFLRNDNYWAPGLPYVDRLVIRWWRDPASRSAAFEAGQLDIATFNPIPPPEITRLTAGGKFIAETKGYSNSAWVTTVEFNQRREIFKKREVRQALMQAIDRDFIADTVFFGRAHPSVGAIASSNTIFFTKDVQAYPFDVKKAGAMLDAAGYPIKSGSRFKLSLVSAGWFEENIKIGQYVKQAFEDLSIDVELTVPDRATSLKRIYTDYDYDVAISNNSGGIELIPTTTQYYTTDGIVKGAAFRNATGYSNPKMDDIVAKMTVETDEAKRIELAHAFDSLAATDIPILPMVDLEPVTIARSDVRNHSTAADFMGDSWSGVWLDR